MTFRSNDDRRPSKFIVLADNMKSAIKMAWDGFLITVRQIHSTSRANEGGGVARPMNIFEVLAILESAVLECKQRNVKTQEAAEALDLLVSYVRPNG